MMETFLQRPKVIEKEPCDNCGETPPTQIYTLELDRPQVERTWYFCSTSCIRKWLASKPKTCTVAGLHTKHNGDATKDCRMPADPQRPVVHRVNDGLTQPYTRS